MTKITKIFIVTIIIASCGSDNIEDKVISDPVNVVVDPMTDKGIGPIVSINLGDINSKSVEEGKKILEKSDLKILSASDLNDAAKKIVEAIK